MRGAMRAMRKTERGTPAFAGVPRGMLRSLLSVVAVGFRQDDIDFQNFVVALFLQ